MGVSRAADARVTWIDGSLEPDAPTRRLLAAAKEDPRAVIALNKRDLALIGDEPAGETPGAIRLSAKDGTGVEGLVRRVAAVLGAAPAAVVAGVGLAAGCGCCWGWWRSGPAEVHDHEDVRGLVVMVGGRRRGGGALADVADEREYAAARIDVVEHDAGFVAGRSWQAAALVEA